MGRKKSDDFYFENYGACAGCAVEAAGMLADILRDFDPDALEGELTRMHEIEQRADERRHELTASLVHAFITPFDREDMEELSDSLDALVDHIEGVLHRVYFTGVRTIRPEALEMADALIRGCNEVAALMEDLWHRRQPDVIQQHLIAINTIEEEADGLFVRSMRRLHTTCDDALEVIAWRDIFTFLEFCADSCEHVAENTGGIVLKHS